MESSNQTTTTTTTKTTPWTLDSFLDSSPPWLLSAAVHVLLLVLLALLMLPRPGQPSIIAEVRYSEYIGDIDDHIAGLLEGVISEDTMMAAEILNPVIAPLLVLPPFIIMPDGRIASTHAPNVQLPIQYSFHGRQEGQQAALLRRGGGNATTQEAVRRGLAWLARVQRPDGSWSLAGRPLNPLRPGGMYPDGAIHENEVAATAMALLAFQGYGVTPYNDREFSENVAAGWRWLLTQQDADGCFFNERAAPAMQRFYTHGLGTIAICELYGMTRREEYREPAMHAIEYLLRHQTPGGGWRYYPMLQENDLSVTGWGLMAMKSARMAGLDVPQEHFNRVYQYLDSVSKDWGARYSYRCPEEATNPADAQATASMTAVGLLCRMYLGWSRDNPELNDGLEFLTRPEHLIRYDPLPSDRLSWQRDVYAWYHTTLVAHHAGAPHWRRWNDVMRQAIPEQQVREGPEAGSWDPHLPTPDAYSVAGGRLYVTCLSIYMLTVYYRHMPLYQNIPTGYEEYAENE